MSVKINSKSKKPLKALTPGKTVKGEATVQRKRAGDYWRTRLNALKHGLAAQTLILPGEDPEEFIRLREEYYDDLKPGGAFEADLVEDLVTIVWKQRRFARTELAYFREAIIKKYEDLVKPIHDEDFVKDFHTITLGPLILKIPEVIYEQLFGTPLWFGSQTKIKELASSFDALLKKKASQLGALEKTVSRLPTGLQLLWELALVSSETFAQFADLHRLSPYSVFKEDWEGFLRWVISFALPYVRLFEGADAVSRSYCKHVMELANVEAMRKLESLARYDAHLWNRRKEITAILVRLREN